MSVQHPRSSVPKQVVVKGSDKPVLAGNELEQRYLSLAELSTATGLSKSTLTRRFKEGRLAGYQPGGPRTRIVFRPNALELAAQVQPGLQEPSPPSTSSPRLAGPPPRWVRGLR